jgi:hypothetical protein
MRPRLAVQPPHDPPPDLDDRYQDHSGAYDLDQRNQQAKRRDAGGIEHVLEHDPPKIAAIA